MTNLTLVPGHVWMHVMADAGNVGSHTDAVNPCVRA